MIRWIRRSFKTRIFFTILLVSLLPLIICDVIMLPILIAHSEQKLSQESAQQMRLIQTAFTDMTKALDQTLLTLSRDETVYTMLAENSADDSALYALLFHAATDTGFYAGIGLYDDQGICRYAINGTDLGTALSTDWGVLHAAGKSTEPVFADGSGDAVFCVAICVRNDEQAIMGFVVFSVDDDGMDRLFSAINDTPSDILLLNARWEPLYHTRSSQGDTVAAALRQQLLSGEKLTGSGGEYAYLVEKENTSGYFIVVQNPKILTDTIVRAFYLVSILMGVLCLLLCFWAAWLLSRHLSRPIQELSHAMGEVERGQYEVRLRENREDELGLLSKGFNRMTREYLLNLKRSVQRQKELNDTRLRMMQAQLNPHFLYNTLDSMKWLGAANDLPQVAEMATDLAFILRSSVTGNNLIPLQQELELVEHYINIQNIRFEDRFACEIDIPERYQGCLVPKLVLQPLVENAILHGVAGQDDGYIKISAQEEANVLIVTVSDNGCGMPGEVLEQLNNPDKRILGGHLGLHNVDSIIKLYFGMRYGITADSGTERGARVSVRLPVMRKEETDVQDFDR